MIENNKNKSENMNEDLDERLQRIIEATEEGFKSKNMAGTVAMRMRAICAVACNLGNLPESYGNLTLKELVIIGNRQRIWNGKRTLTSVVQDGVC